MIIYNENSNKDTAFFELLGDKLHFSLVHIASFLLAE